MRHANIVLRKNPYLTPVAADKLITVSVECFVLLMLFTETLMIFLQDPLRLVRKGQKETPQAFDCVSL